MKKNRILLITLMMAVALIGLVIMQINWIKHDYELREEKFGQQVTTAIHNAVANIETRESVHLIARNISSTFLQDSVKRFFTETALPRLPEPIAVFEAIGPDSLEIPDANAFTFVSEMDSTPEGQFRIVTHHSKDGENVSISVNSVPGSGNTTVTTVNVKEQINKAKEMGQKARELAQQSVQLQEQKKMMAVANEKVKRKAQKLNRVFEKMAVEYDRRSFNLVERISPASVDSLVGVELQNSGIRLPYSITLQNGMNDSVVWKRADTLINPVPDKEYAAILFPGDITNRNDKVIVGFNDTFGYFISSMWMMLLSSAVFTSIVIFAFAYTLNVIFRQKKLSDIKNDFINNMTHEFKTPIATIRLATEAISNPEIIKDADKVKHYTKIIKDENDRMNGHVENILQIAQFDKRSFAQELVATDMHEIIRNTIEMMQLQTLQKGGQVNFSPGAEKAFVNADPGFISMAILNLLDNALKYTDQTPVIDIHTGNRNGQLVISVTDNGIGMKPETCEKIFDKFYRVTTGNLHNVKGFGLGLSYVKAIVTAHEGTVKAESQPGKGSCFEITLPAINHLPSA